MLTNTEFYTNAVEALNWIILIYAISIMASYFILAIYSAWAIGEHFNHNNTANFENILRSPLAPKIAVIAPAYNESISIVDNIRSLLSLHYNNYEIVIVNDGSKDDSMQKMIDAYHLVPTQQEKYSELLHKNIRQLYRSTNKAFYNLLVVDKENGGKSDALNAGINHTDAKYVANVDVDCIIEDDALLRMVKPFLESIGTKVIATGGVIRMANDCIVSNGRILEVKLPKKILPLFQTLEYLRAFLLGRMAWSKLNGLLLISGAFGLFDREILIEAGGYEHDTVGEDMELVVRMRRLMQKKKEAYRVSYIPDPLCWTEAPTSSKILMRQRNRWTRGTIETLFRHIGLFFNPKYGVLGLLSYPFWFFFEWLAPIVEFFGLIYFCVLWYFDLVNWPHFWLLLGVVYCFAIMISWFAILMEELTFRQYKSTGALFKLLGIALLEPIIFHPLTVWAAIKGNWDKFIRRKKTWGVQVRTGFQQANKIEPTSTISED